MIISNAFASTTEQSIGFGSSLMPFLLVLAIFYILLIRPQQKKMKQHDELVANLKIGDKVLTAGGIIGSVSRINTEKDIITIKIASSVEIEVLRSTIHTLLKDVMNAKKNKKNITDKKKRKK